MATEFKIVAIPEAFAHLAALAAFCIADVSIRPARKSLEPRIADSLRLNELAVPNGLDPILTHLSSLTFGGTSGLSENHQGGKTGGLTVRMKF